MHPYFQMVARGIKRGVAVAFLEKFERPIEVDMEMRPDGEGNPRAHFSFRFQKPALLPTALERAFFEGAIAGYGACLNTALAVENEFNVLVPVEAPEPETRQ